MTGAGHPAPGDPALEDSTPEDSTTVHDLGRGRGAGVRRAAVAAVVRGTVRPVLNGWAPLSWRRRWLPLAGRLGQRLPPDVAVSSPTLGRRRAWLLHPAGAPDDRAVLYLHGGGYTYGDLGTHGAAVALLARLAGAPTWMPDYRVVPEHPSSAPLEDALTAWRDLAGRVDPARIVVAGDSAGAHLALSLACELRDLGEPGPAGLVLLSPWVDADPALAARRPRDVVLSRRLMERDTRTWVGDGDHADPLLSPINRDLHGLPPALVQWGRHEALHHDAERVVAGLAGSGVEVTAEAFEGLWHDAFLHVPLLPEAARWLARTAVWVEARQAVAAA